MYSYTLLWQTWEGSKCLSNRRERRRKVETKARVIPLWETRNKTAWHQSPPKETHTHTHTQMLDAFTHTHTCVKWLLGRSSDASDRACQREWRELQHMQTKKTYWGRGEKKTQKGIILATCVFLEPPFTTLAKPPTNKNHQSSCLLLKHFQPYFNKLWLCLPNVMCKQ